MAKTAKTYQQQSLSRHQADGCAGDDAMQALTFWLGVPPALPACQHCGALPATLLLLRRRSAERKKASPPGEKKRKKRKRKKKEEKKRKGKKTKERKKQKKKRWRLRSCLSLLRAHCRCTGDGSRMKVTEFVH